MKCSNEFIEEIKREYPDDEELFKKLKGDHYFLGEFLLKGCKLKINPWEALNDLKRGEIQAIKEAFEKFVRRIEIYMQWCKVTESELDSNIAKFFPKEK